MAPIIYKINEKITHRMLARKNENLKKKIYITECLYLHYNLSKRIYIQEEV